MFLDNKENVCKKSKTELERLNSLPLNYYLGTVFKSQSSCFSFQAKTCEDT